MSRYALVLVAPLFAAAPQSAAAEPAATPSNKAAPNLSNSKVPPGATVDPAKPPAEKPQTGTETPAVVLDGSAADAVLGKAVQTSKGEDLGRIVDIIVDRSGSIRAAVIDFGGFLGVGSRKIAIDWRLLHYPKTGPMDKLVADLSQDQLRIAPLYKSGEPVVVMGRTGTAVARPSPPKP